MNYLKVIIISSVSIWLGAMAFFSFFVAPRAFSLLGREQAGLLVGAVFPRYYVFGIVMGIIALIGVLGRMLGGQHAPSWGSLVLVLVMLGLTFYAFLVLLPQAEQAKVAMRTAGAATDAAGSFARIHALSVVLNLVTMLAGLALIIVEGLRPKG